MTACAGKCHSLMWTHCTSLSLSGYVCGVVDSDMADGIGRIDVTEGNTGGSN